MTDSNIPHLFKGYGLELEYMIVHRDSLEVFPVSDEVLRHEAGSYVNDVERGLLGWSNELVLHVIEIKNNEPVAEITGLAEKFQAEISAVNTVLEPMGGCLMPSAMHPWMDPHTETRLWPHGSRRIYEAYNRIFDCRGHGWSNLQSTHINLGFNGDREFARLHAAIRIILPLLPAVAASSPFVDAKASGLYDTRLDFYRRNQRLVPSIAGMIIPEKVYSKEDYARQIHQRIYRDIAHLDPEAILRDEWLNSRGAIARFQRNAIEIRLIDIQECPLADLAVAAGIITAIKALAAEQWASFDLQSAMDEESLRELLLATISGGEHAVITDKQFLSLLGFPDRSASAGEIWRHLSEATGPFWKKELSQYRKTFDSLLDKGTLSGRLLKKAGKNPSRQRLQEIYQELCRCLSQGELFDA